jgi:hypothetical protein
MVVVRVVSPPKIRRIARMRTSERVPINGLASRNLVDNLRHREYTMIPAKDLPGAWIILSPRRRREDRPRSGNLARRVIFGKILPSILRNFGKLMTS